DGTESSTRRAARGADRADRARRRGGGGAARSCAAPARRPARALSRDGATRNEGRRRQGAGDARRAVTHRGVAGGVGAPTSVCSVAETLYHALPGARDRVALGVMRTIAIAAFVLLSGAVAV